jgi:hypothetical protein
VITFQDADNYRLWNLPWKYLRMDESTPYVTMNYTSTVPVPCPPCSVTYTVSYHADLLLSSCSITFSNDDPPGMAKELRIRAVQMAGSYTRWSAIRFSSPTTSVSGSSWDSYQLDEIPVSSVSVIGISRVEPH